MDKKKKVSSIYKHYKDEHIDLVSLNLISQFHILAKCKHKFECLLTELLFICKLVQDLNEESLRLSSFKFFKFPLLILLI